MRTILGIDTEGAKGFIDSKIEIFCSLKNLCAWFMLFFGSSGNLNAWFIFRLILPNSKNSLPMTQKKRCLVDLPVELQMVEENNEGSLKEDPMKGGEIGRELDKQKLKKKEKV